MAVNDIFSDDAVLRRLGEADMEEVSALEALCFDSSWSPEQYREACRGGWQTTQLQVAQKQIEVGGVHADKRVCSLLSRRTIS